MFNKFLNRFRATTPTVEKKSGRKSSGTVASGNTEGQPTRKARSSKKTPKEIATANNEPYIAVLSVNLDNEHGPRYGSFELDWNMKFIETLVENGYSGENAEAIIGQWFKDVCRTVAMEDVAAAPDNVRFINRTSLGGGKTEVS